MNHDVIFICNLLKNIDKCAVGKVADLSTPHFHHSVEIQVLDEYVVVVTTEVVSEFPHKISMFINQFLLQSAIG